MTVTQVPSACSTAAGPGQGPGDSQPLPHPLEPRLGVGDSHAEDPVAGSRYTVCPWDQKLKLGNPFAFLSWALGTALRGRGRGLSPMEEDPCRRRVPASLGGRWLDI